MPGKAKPQRLPNGYEPAHCDLATCPDPSCNSTATRFVFQHLCGTEKRDGSLANITWEAPAYVGKDDKKPHKWKCPLCNQQDVAPVLLKCGECGRVVKASNS